MQLIEFNNRIELYNHAYNLIRGLAPKTMGLSGGTTPFPLYQMLKDNIEAKMFQIDERYTNDTDELNQVKIDQNFDNVVYFNTALPLNECRQDYENKLEKELKNPLDIAILGIGIDGHFASLFEVYENKIDKVLITKAPEIYKSKTRLTINKHIIMESKLKLILLVGRDKKNIINKIYSCNEEDFLASTFKDDKNTLILYSND